MNIPEPEYYTSVFKIDWGQHETLHPMEDLFECVKAPNYYKENHYENLIEELTPDLKDSFKTDLDIHEDFTLSLESIKFKGTPEVVTCTWSSLPVISNYYNLSDPPTNDYEVFCTGVYHTPFSEEKLVYFCTDTMEEYFLHGDHEYLECPLCERTIAEVNPQEMRVCNFNSIEDLDYGNYPDESLFDDLPRDHKIVRICNRCLQEKTLAGVSDPGLFGIPCEVDYESNQVYIKRNFTNILGTKLNNKNAKDYSGWFKPHSEGCYFPVMFYNRKDIEEAGFTEGESFFVSGSCLKLNTYCLEQIKLGNYVLIDIDAHGMIEAHVSVYIKPVGEEK